MTIQVSPKLRKEIECSLALCDEVCEATTYEAIKHGGPAPRWTPGGPNGLRSTVAVPMVFVDTLTETEQDLFMSNLADDNLADTGGL